MLTGPTKAVILLALATALGMGLYPPRQAMINGMWVSLGYGPLAQMPPAVHIDLARLLVQWALVAIGAAALALAIPHLSAFFSWLTTATAPLPKTIDATYIARLDDGGLRLVDCDPYAGPEARALAKAELARRQKNAATSAEQRNAGPPAATSNGDIAAAVEQPPAPPKDEHSAVALKERADAGADRAQPPETQRKRIKALKAGVGVLWVAAILSLIPALTALSLRDTAAYLLAAFHGLDAIVFVVCALGLARRRPGFGFAGAAWIGIGIVIAIGSAPGIPINWPIVIVRAVMAAFIWRGALSATALREASR